MNERKAWLEKELTRVRGLLARPNFKYPNMAQCRIAGLERQIRDADHPWLVLIRDTVANIFLCIGNWIKNL